jgi:hypothetical protein
VVFEQGRPEDTSVPASQPPPRSTCLCRLALGLAVNNAGLRHNRRCRAFGRGALSACNKVASEPQLNAVPVEEVLQRSQRLG